MKLIRSRSLNAANSGGYYAAAIVADFGTSLPDGYVSLTEELFLRLDGQSASIAATLLDVVDYSGNPPQDVVLIREGTPLPDKAKANRQTLGRAKRLAKLRAKLQLKA